MTTNYKSAIRDYLRSEVKFRKREFPKQDKRCMSIAEYVLKHGKMFDIAPLDADEVKLLKETMRFSPEIKSCYGNAMRLWLDEEDFKYVEGYAQGIMPVLHAWNTINGKVIDVTWESGVIPRRLKYMELPKLSKGDEYFGVVFSDEFMRKHMIEVVKRERWISVLDDWEAGYPILERNSSKGG